MITDRSPFSKPRDRRTRLQKRSRPRFSSAARVLIFSGFLVAGLLFLSACTQDSSPLEGSRQCILVISEHPDSSTAFLSTWERTESGPWEAAALSAEVNLGRSGLAWGRGLHPLTKDMESAPKQEGDGRSPAGVFSLSKVMGFAAAAPLQIKMPYLPISEGVECVDDIHSAHYNLIRDRKTEVNPDWNSSEDMIRYAGHYDLLITVDHNTKPVEPGLGSCIFLHLRPDPEKSTAGCTAMDRAPMEELLTWLDESLSPRLVQLSRSDYLLFRRNWDLPGPLPN